jgi:predicted nucleic acid-binding Zn ribbon protein
MRKGNAESIGDVIKQMLKRYNLEQKLSEVTVIEVWQEVVGTPIARHTLDLYVNKQKLFVKLDSAVVRNELKMVKTQLIIDLNEAAGREVIVDIVLR